MKILNTGNKKAALWWVDKTIACKVCDRSVQLEESDATSASVRIPNVHQLVYTCETCSNEVVIDNDATLITEEAPTSPITTPSASTHNPRAAHVGSVADESPKTSHAASVGNTVTVNSWSNPFKGTSWGV
jgi:uncharacterized protein YlaI